MSVTRLASASALCASLAASGCGADGPLLPGDQHLAVWSEHLADADVRAALPQLAGEHADLYLAIPRARIGDPELAWLITDSAAAGVGVRAWILVSMEDGYWATESNAPAMRDAALAFADWREQQALPVDWEIFDMEMSYQRTMDVLGAIDTNGVTAGLDLIKQGRDPAAFAVHRDEYAALVHDVQARGLKVMSVTYPMVLDDPDDGDDDIQDEMDVPTHGIDWDAVSFMAYQSQFAQLSGMWHGADLIYSYGASARAQYGDRADLALGLVGPMADWNPNPYPDPQTLAADVAAARAAGTPRTSIYSLDGILGMGTVDPWLDDSIAPAVPPAEDGEYSRRIVRGLFD